MKNKIITSLFLVAIYLCLLFVLKSLDIYQTRFDVDGIVVPLYVFLKIIFACYFMLVLLSAGAALQHIILPRADISSVGAGFYIISCSFLGASVIALLMFIIGFFNAYHFITALIITVPVVGLFPFTLSSALTVVKSAFYRIITTNPLVVSLAYTALLLLTLGVALFMLIHKGIFPGALDSDVWMHYLHYYREVTTSGGIWPNDLWWHFYISKGSGLFFLAILLTDVMAPPVVSCCFVVLSAVIVYDLLRQYTISPLWPMLGTLLVLLALSLTTNQYSMVNTTTSFFKHPIVLMGFVALTIWCTVKFADGLTKDASWLLGITGTLSFFYIGIYNTSMTIPIIVMWFFEIAAISTLFRSRNSYQPYKGRLQTYVFIGFAVAVLLGISTAFLINYSITGLGEIPPLRFMWAFVDKEKFSQLWSPWIYYVLVSFERANVSLQNIFHIDAGWILQLSRLWFFRTVPLLTGIIAVVGILWIWWSRRVFTRVYRMPCKRLRLILYTSLFLGNAMLYAQLFKGNTSLFRWYNFVVLFIVLLIIQLWSIIIDPVCQHKPISLTLIVLLCAGFFINDMPVNITEERLSAIGRFISGKMSIKDALLHTDSMTSKYINNDTRLSHFIEASSYMEDGGKMLYMGQDCGPGYFFPSYVVSEPSFAFGNKYNVALFESPDKARAVYQELGINYFATNLRRVFFVFLPFSPLFESDNLQKYFELLYFKDDFCLFTWKTENSRNVIPKKLLSKIEQKQLKERRGGRGIYYDTIRNKYLAGIPLIN